MNSSSKGQSPKTEEAKQTEVADGKISSSNGTSNPTAMFPHKLHKMLEDVEKEGNESIISWLPDGKSFKVHDREKFEQDLMPKYFGSSKYRSFQKNLNLWGFITVLTPLSNPHRGEVSNPNFLKGCPENLEEMKRVVKSKLKLKQQNHQRREGVPQEVMVQSELPLQPAAATRDQLSIVDDSSASRQQQQHQTLLQAVAAATLFPPQGVPSTAASILESATGRQQDEEALRLLESIVLSRRLGAAVPTAERAKKNPPVHEHQSSVFQAHHSSVRPTLASDSPLVQHIRRREDGGETSSGLLVSKKNNAVLPVSLLSAKTDDTAGVARRPTSSMPVTSSQEASLAALSSQDASQKDQEEALRLLLLRVRGGAGAPAVNSESRGAISRLSLSRSLLDQALAVAGTDGYDETNILGTSLSSSSAATAASRTRLLQLQGLAAPTPTSTNDTVSAALEDLLRMRRINRLNEAEAAARLLQQQQLPPPRRSLNSLLLSPRPEQQALLPSRTTMPPPASTSNSASAAELLQQLYQIRALNQGHR